MKKKVTDPIFNDKKIIIGLNHSTYCVDYYLYRPKKNSKEQVDVIKDSKAYSIYKTNNACFSGVSSTCCKFFNDFSKPANRFRFMCKKNLHAKEEVRLSDDEIKEWVILCKKNGMMPESVDDRFISKGIYDISLDKLTREELYVQLLSARYVQEEPYFVRGVLSLINDTGLGFFTSFYIASVMLTYNSGHHIISKVRRYGLNNNTDINKNTVEELNTFDFTHVAALSKYLKGKKTGKIVTEDYDNLGSFRLHNALSDIAQTIKKKKRLLVYKKDLKTTPIEDLIVNS